MQASPGVPKTGSSARWPLAGPLGTCSRLFRLGAHIQAKDIEKLPPGRALSLIAFLGFCPLE